MNKLFLSGLFMVVLSYTVSAQEPPGFSPSVFSFDNSGLTVGFLAGDDSFAWDYTPGERAGIIGLNFLFGIGSYSQGHPGHGFLLTLMEAGGIALVALPSVNGWKIGLSDQGKNRSNSQSSSSNSSKDNYYNDDLTPEGNLVVWCWLGGGALLLTDVIFSIVWPLNYHRSAGKNAQLNDARNWNVAFVPGTYGIQQGQISFTAHF
jgi:hypothetical protein